MQQIIWFYNLLPMWLTWCAWHFCKRMDLLSLHWSHLSSLSVSYVILLTSIFQTCISQLVCYRGIWNVQQKDLRFYKMQAYIKRILGKKNIAFLDMWKIMFVREWIFCMPWYILSCYWILDVRVVHLKVFKFEFCFETFKHFLLSIHVWW